MASLTTINRQRWQDLYDIIEEEGDNVVIRGKGAQATGVSGGVTYAWTVKYAALKVHRQPFMQPADNDMVFSKHGIDTRERIRLFVAYIQDEDDEDDFTQPDIIQGDRVYYDASLDANKDTDPYYEVVACHKYPYYFQVWAERSKGFD